MDRGFSQELVQRRLGHTSITMTLHTHPYWTPSMGRHAADVMDEPLKIILRCVHVLPSGSSANYRTPALAFGIDPLDPPGIGQHRKHIDPDDAGAQSAVDEDPVERSIESSRERCDTPNMIGTKTRRPSKGDALKLGLAKLLPQEGY